MLAAYRVDVTDPAITARRLRILVDRLPPTARVGGEDWSVESHLLALLVDHIAQLTYVTVRQAGSKTTRPKPLPRPKRAPARGPGPGPEPARPAERAAVATDAKGRRKTSSWADAIMQLAGMPGVVTDNRG